VYSPCKFWGRVRTLPQNLQGEYTGKKRIWHQTSLKNNEIRTHFSLRELQDLIEKVVGINLMKT